MKQSIQAEKMAKDAFEVRARRLREASGRLAKEDGSWQR